MKQVFDWDIKIHINLPDTRQKVTLTVSIFITFQELGLKIASQLGLNSLETIFDFIVQNEKYPPNPIKPQNNLRQMNIKSGQTIIGKLRSYQGGFPKPEDYTDGFNIIPKEDYDLYKPKTRQSTFGLIVEAICANPKCLNKCKSQVVPLGLGEFTLDHIQSKLLCQVCPYRNSRTIPPLTITNLKLMNCSWTVQGYYKDKHGINTMMKKSEFRVARGEENSELYNLIERYNWTEMRILVKNI